MARVLAWYTVVVVALAAAFAAVPDAQQWAVGATCGISIGAIEYGVRRQQPRRAGAWRCLAVAIVILGVGDITFIGAQADGAVPYPSASDLVTVVGYFVLAIALSWLGWPVAPARDETSAIDAIGLTVAGALIVWLTLVRPAVDQEGLGAIGRGTAVAAMLGYLAVFASSVRIVLGWRRNAAVILLGAAMLWFLVSELYHGHQLVSGTLPHGGRVDLGLLALAAFCGAAALTPTMRDVSSPASGRYSLRPWRLAAIAAGMLVAPVVLIVKALRGTAESGIAIASVASIVSFLVLVRLAMSGRAYQVRAAREHAARVASQAMVSATTPADVVDGTRDALRSLKARHGPIGVEFVERAPTAERLNQVVGTQERAQFAVPLAGSEAALIFSGPRSALADLVDLLRSLANQAAVVLQRINLAEAARAEERERYFRTLVLTSTDAILISRNGRVEYATPSADRFFGRDIVGECFEDVVEPVDGPEWSDSVVGAEGRIHRGDGDVTVVVHRRDLVDDPTVRGVVTTLRDVTAERVLQRDLAYRASHDELTGMENTRAWSETLSAERDRRRGPGHGAAVIFIDLDDFKRINDTYGHPTGDVVLAETARRIQECLRGGDVAARIGGDEFAVLLRDVREVEDARTVAQRLAQALNEPVVVGSERIEGMASIGLAYTEDQERIDALVQRADTALYAAKEQGKGRWTEYNPMQWKPSHRLVHDGRES